MKLQIIVITALLGYTIANPAPTLGVTRKRDLEVCNLSVSSEFLLNAPASFSS